MYVYPTPTPPWTRPYPWRFQPLLSDLKRLGQLTDNMSEARVFLLVNHIDRRSTNAVRNMLERVRKKNPRFSWRNHYLMLPCDHGPGDCMFSPEPPTPQTATVHPQSSRRRLRYMMVSGSRQYASFNKRLDLRIPVHMTEVIYPRKFVRTEQMERDTLFFWGGSVRHSGIRADLRAHHSKRPGFYIPTNQNVRFEHWMARSVFCGSPPGWDEGDSNRYLPSMVHGCVPVFLLDGEAMPFEELLPWNGSVVRLKRRQIPRLHEILTSFTRTDIGRMRASLPSLLAALTYAARTPRGWPSDLRAIGAGKTFLRGVERGLIGA